MAIEVEDKIGLMLPCNVIVQEHEDGTIEVSTVDPLVSMAGIHNSSLSDIAGNVREKLKMVIERV
jgi:uncharacterized protein (DUF302 family)